MSAEQPDSGRASDVPTPNRKEKKRVVWHSDSKNADRHIGASSTAEGAADLDTQSPNASPTLPDQVVLTSPPSGELDAFELTRKLSKVLSDDKLALQVEQSKAEYHHQQRQQQQQQQLQLQQQHGESSQQTESSPDANLRSPIRRPRPALRRNTSYDAPHEHEEADMAEKHADVRTLQSINDAKYRAEALAKSLGSHSAPGSRRNSSEFGATFQPLIADRDKSRRGRRHQHRPAVVVEDYDADVHAAAGPADDHQQQYQEREAFTSGSGSFGSRAAADAPGGATAAPPRGRTGRAEVSDQQVRHRRSHQAEPSDNDDDDYDSFDEHELAANLVRSHTRKNKTDLFISRPPRSGASGTSTPVIQQDYVQDYVPRPKKYRGGVLASLLKLYNDDRTGGVGSTGSSGHNTPTTAPATPRSLSPVSRPSSRAGWSSTPGTPGGGPGTPRSRPTSGLFSLHRSRNSTSSLALTELMKSSSMFAGPGSSELSGRMADRIKQEQVPPPKSKKDKIKITVHIAAILSRHRYLLKLCRALMMYGAPTHRLEEYLIMSARVLEIDGQFLYIPSCMIISFDDSTTHTTEVKIVRVPQGIDLGRLRDVHDIYKNVVHDKMGVEEATRLLDEVMERKPKFNVWFRVFLYGVASACVGPFAFKARFIDLPIAFILGCLLGIMQLVFAPSNELYAHVFEVSASVVTSFLARGFGSIKGGELFCFSALAQSSIALILPGYMVLCSSLELQSHNIVAGSVRMVHAMIYTLFLGYGITIGATLYGMLDENAVSDTECAAPLHRNWYFLFVPGFTLCLCLVNQSKWRQTPVMIVMALAGFCVSSYTSEYFQEGNTQISNMLGALTIGILANLYSRLGRHFENAWYDVVDFWQQQVMPRVSRLRRSRAGEKWHLPSDTESRPGSPVEEKPVERKSTVGYSLAAAAMLPAIFVQVPSGLAANGSLLAGIESANSLTGQNGTATRPDSYTSPTPFNVLLLVIQVAISISVGLFMSALIVYPLGKRRSGLFSF